MASPYITFFLSHQQSLKHWNLVSAMKCTLKLVRKCSEHNMRIIKTCPWWPFSFFIIRNLKLYQNLLAPDNLSRVGEPSRLCKREYSTGWSCKFQNYTKWEKVGFLVKKLFYLSNNLSLVRENYLNHICLDFVWVCRVVFVKQPNEREALLGLSHNW